MLFKEKKKNYRIRSFRETLFLSLLIVLRYSTVVVVLVVEVVVVVLENC